MRVYNSYPWGAAFCTLSPARLMDGSVARPWSASSSTLSRQSGSRSAGCGGLPGGAPQWSEAKLGCLPDRVLNHPTTDPGSGRDLVHAPLALPVLANLIADNAQHRQLADRELAGQRRRHWARSSEVAMACPIAGAGISDPCKTALLT